MPDDLDELFSVAPEDFVAARNRLAKEWRAGGRRDEAKVAAALRRPSVADWALNAVAREHASDAGALVEAAERLRAVQAGALEGRGGDVRAALTELRAASTTVHRRADEVLGRAGRDRGAQAAAISARLNEVAANEGVAEQFGAARLGSAPVEERDPFGGLDAGPAAPERSTRRAPARARSGDLRDDREPAPEPAPRPDPEARRRHAAEQRRLRDALTAARKARTAAEAALAKADAALDAARQAAVHAEHRRDDAQGRVDEAVAAEADADEAMTRHDGTPI